ncbi:MAG: hypothetical protein ABIN67_21320 [Ferruginibacter sp.]
MSIRLPYYIYDLNLKYQPLNFYNFFYRKNFLLLNEFGIAVIVKRRTTLNRAPNTNGFGTTSSVPVLSTSALIFLGKFVVRGMLDIGA